MLQQKYKISNREYAMKQYLYVLGVFQMFLKSKYKIKTPAPLHILILTVT